MVHAVRRLAVTAAILFFSFSSVQAMQHSGSQSKHAEKESAIDVMGYVSNHYHLTLAGYDIPLPRILLVEGNWHAYWSTEAAAASDDFILKHHTLIPSGDAQITIDLSISSHLIYFWFGFGLTLLLSLAMARKYKKGIGRDTEPEGWFQNVFEATFVFIRDNVAREHIPEKKYKKFMPYLFTVFLGILFMNLFGLFPWGVTATADVTVTALLAIFTFVLTQWNGTKQHWEHVFWFPGVPTWSRFILAPVEFIGLFAKPFALCIRLFANMIAGKIMIVCFLGLIFIFAQIFGAIAGWVVTPIAVLLTLGVYILKFAIALIQAYIFVLLSAVFIGMAAEEHGSHETEENRVGAEVSSAHT